MRVEGRPGGGSTAEGQVACQVRVLWVTLRFIHTHTPLYPPTLMYLVPWSEFPIVPFYPHYPYVPRGGNPEAPSRLLTQTELSQTQPWTLNPRTLHRRNSDEAGGNASLFFANTTTSRQRGRSDETSGLKQPVITQKGVFILWNTANSPEGSQFPTLALIPQPSSLISDPKSQSLSPDP